MSSTDYFQETNQNDNNGTFQENSDNKDFSSILDDPNFNFDCTWLIRIRGLPWTATKKEIVDFFEGVNILNGENGVHLITMCGNKARPLGEAYIQLATEEDFKLAQTFHRQNMGPRYIEIFTAKFEDFKNILSKQLNLRQDAVVRLRGLPWNSTEKDIAEFFKGLQICEDKGIHIHYDRSGRASGEAFVRFQTLGDCDQAMKRNMEELGNRYIEVFRATESQLLRSIEVTADNRDRKSNNWVGNSNGNGNGNGNGSGSGNNRNHPYDRFGGNNGGNQRTSRNNRNIRGGGSRSGDDDRNFGNNNRNFSSLSNFGGTNNFGNSGSRGGSLFNDFGMNGNGGNGNNFRGNGNNGGGFFGNNGGSFGNNGGNFGSNGGNGFGNNNFGNNGGGNFGNNGYGNNNYGSNGGGFSGNGGSNFGGNGNFGNSGNNSFGNNFDNDRGGRNFGNNSGGGGGGQEEHLVFMRGMPYYCDEMDIYKFFSPLKPNRCKIILNDSAMPSGQAVASFDSHEEATIALRKDKEKMGSRYIELFYDGQSGQSRKRF